MILYGSQNINSVACINNALPSSIY